MAENLPVRDLQLEDQLQLLNAIDSVRSQGLGELVLTFEASCLSKPDNASLQCLSSTEYSLTQDLKVWGREEAISRLATLEVGAQICW